MGLYAPRLRHCLGGLRVAFATRGSAGRSEVIERRIRGGVEFSEGAGRKVYLVGFMGAGKTSVGSCLAELMGIEFRDLDGTVEADAAMSIAQIFAEKGEQQFRSLERAALLSIADLEGDFVVATGGGTAVDEENVERMRATGMTFWLDPSFDAIIGRMSESGRRRRPLFAVPAQAKVLYEERRESYANAGTRIEIEASEESEVVAKRIMKMVLDRDRAAQAG